MEFGSMDLLGVEYRRMIQVFVIEPGSRLHYVGLFHQELGSF